MLLRRIHASCVARNSDGFDEEIQCKSCNQDIQGSVHQHCGVGFFEKIELTTDHRPQSLMTDPIRKVNAISDTSHSDPDSDVLLLELHVLRVLLLRFSRLGDMNSRRGKLDVAYLVGN